MNTGEGIMSQVKKSNKPFESRLLTIEVYKNWLKELDNSNWPKVNDPYPFVTLLERMGMRPGIYGTYFGCYRIGINIIGKVLVDLKAWWLTTPSDHRLFYKWFKDQVIVDYVNKDIIEVERIYLTN